MLECAANLACVGAEPLGLTNCLNFGNPEKPHVAWQLSESVRGLADACRALDVPVVGGNVSLYNEAPDGPIYPTPIVGMVGPAARCRARGADWLRARGRRDRLLRRVQRAPAGQRAGQAARRGAARRPARRRPRQGPRRAGGRARRGPGGRPLQRPRRGRGRLPRRGRRVAAWRAAWARRSRVPDEDVLSLAVRRGARRGLRGLGRAEAIDRLAERTADDVFGTVGGDALEVTGSARASRVSLAELRDAHSSLSAAFA